MPKIVVILTNEYADWEFAPVAAFAKSFYDFDVTIASPDAAQVISLAGLIAKPSLSIDEIMVH